MAKSWFFGWLRQLARDAILAGINDAADILDEDNHNNDAGRFMSIHGPDAIGAPGSEEDEDEPAKLPAPKSAANGNGKAKRGRGKRS